MYCSVTKCGLCNRLRSLIGLMYVAKSKNINLYVLSVPTRSCPEDLNNLFIFPNYVIVYNNMKQFELLADKNYIIYDGTSSSIIESMNMNLDKDKFKEVFLEIQPTDHIKNIIKKITKEYDLINCHGIHIRMTDHYKHRMKYYQYMKPNELLNDELIVDIDSVSTLIKSFNDQLKIFISTDCNDTYEYFLKEYPNRIFRYGGNIERNRNDVKRAVVELYLLSNCKTFNGTAYSSFSGHVKNLRKTNRNNF